MVRNINKITNMNVKPIKTEKINLDREVQLEIPFFNLENLPDYFCARYARLSSQFSFGKIFPVAHAWNMRSKQGVIITPVNNRFFELPFHRKQIKPGSLVGIYTSDSRYNGELKPYTHLSLYLGEKNRHSLFLEQYIHDIRLIKLKDYERGNMEIREVLSINSL
jgi:hypothetical protein